MAGNESNVCFYLFLHASQMHPGPHWVSGIAAPWTWLTGVVQELSSFSIPVCTSHTGLAAGHPGQQLITFPHSDVGCVLKNMKWEQDLPLCMAHAFTSYLWVWSTHNTQRRAWTGGTGTAQLSHLKTARICWPWHMARGVKSIHIHYSSRSIDTSV